ncbi:MAG: histidine phosphatase family protein [Candidatus Latescibacteria bacterium]|jgi:2,3-bisphosphoglycerate-dependent phosphoglycerate mutase/probable phosphoglycerate mutase|nr:histidine phosphatase family protein [Candidatus Latescibacterota bacterium]
MELYLIRHGQSFNNAHEGTNTRVADPPLTEIGQAQAQLVADFLKTAEQTEDCGYKISELFCSAMLRTLQTTAPIAKVLGLTPTIWLDVHEECGIWLDEGDGPVGHSGLTRKEIEAQFPGFVIPNGVTDDGWWNRPKETYAEAIVRARRVADEILDRDLDSDCHLAIVTHGAFANIFIQVLLGQDPLEAVYFGHYNTGISRIDFVGGMIRPRYLNRVEHLVPHLRT